MKIRAFLILSGLMSALIPGAAPAQTPNFSGTWVLNLDKSDFSQVNETMPLITLTIKHEGTALAIKRSIEGLESEDRELRYTTDGKDCLNAGKSFKDLKSTCALKDGKIFIQGEAEGVTAASMGGGEPTIDYFKYKTVQEYSLSADQSVLTVASSLEMEDGVKKMTLVYDRKK
jgi:hypothetical protein